jgi:hypothetical protein
MLWEYQLGEAADSKQFLSLLGMSDELFITFLNSECKLQNEFSSLSEEIYF